MNDEEPRSKLPPRWAAQFLRRFCDPDLLPEIEGDLYEMYRRWVEEYGVQRARWRYALNVTTFLRPFAIRKKKNELYYSINRTAMLRNYLKIAYRSLLKNKAFSLINILGLAIGTAAFILIASYVQFETSYDTFQAERVYRVGVHRYQNGALESKDAYTAPALGPTISTKVSGIKDCFRLTPWAEKHIVVYEKDQTEAFSYPEENAIFADASFVKYFSLDMVAAASDSLLVAPQQILLSESTAEKYFGADWQSEHVLGELLTVYNSNRDAAVTFSVQGVFTDLPPNSHLDYDLIFSHATLPEFLPPDIPEAMRLGMFENAWGPNAWYTYVVLDEQALAPAVSQRITELIAQQNEADNAREAYVLQPVHNIHLYSDLANEPTATGNATFIYALALIALFTLVIAWINYINLSTARATDRAREVGLRKVVGARRTQLVGQFLLETSMINMLALGLALVLVQLATPYFSSMTGIDFDQPSSGRTVLGWIVVGTWLVGTFLAGFYPAFVLSSFRPVTALKNRVARSTRGMGLRQSLVVFQFAISLILIVGTAVIYEQIQYMRQQDLGIDTQQTLVVEAPIAMDQTVPFLQTVATLRSELESEAGVESVTAASQVPGRPEELSRRMHRVGQSEATAVDLTEVLVDHQYLPTLDVDFIAGRNFATNADQNTQKMVLNEAAVEQLGFANAEAALGAKLGMYTHSGLSEYEVIGVIANYHQASLQYDYQPIGFFYEIYEGDYLIKLSGTQNTAQTLDLIQERWASTFPNNPFNYYFLDQLFAQQYRADQRFGSVFATFALLAIFIACLGLFGLSSYATAQRTKEIGIRKVLGASASRLAVMLSRDFVKLVLIANFIALPIAGWLMRQWLSDYAFRIEITGWLLIAPVLLVAAIAMITVGFQTVKTALANPVDSLRNE